MDGVGSFTSPCIDTRQQGLMAFRVSLTDTLALGENENAQVSKRHLTCESLTFY